MIKTIYILWFQGFEQAPQVVQKCVASWRVYNPDWKIVLLDKHNLKNYIRLENVDKFNKTALSDVIRISLLYSFGGLWVDATTFCNKSLNEWLPNYIHQGFFAFDRPGIDRLISSWFLYSEKGNYITEKWYHKAIQYYQKNENPHTYFWFHYIFGDLYTLDNTFQKIWDQVPKLSANGIGPHYLLEKGYCNTLTKEVKTDIDSKITPLYKLTYKTKFPEYNIKMNLYYLYSTI
jgi:hypothetical protein